MIMIMIMIIISLPAKKIFSNIIRLFKKPLSSRELVVVSDLEVR